MYIHITRGKKEEKKERQRAYLVASGSELLGNVLCNEDLVFVLLLAVSVRAVDHDLGRQLVLGDCRRFTRGEVSRLS